MKVALALGLALVLGVGVASFAQTLSGSWDSAVSIVPSPVSLGIRSELIVAYAMSGWSFSSDTVLTDAGWASQRFDASGALGGVTLGSALTFDPASVAFASWTVTSSASLAGVSLSGTFTLLTNNAKLVLGVSGTAGMVDARAAVTFGDQNLPGCDYHWAGVDITVGFPFSCADVSSTVSFDCDGFSYAEFMVVGIAIPGLPWVTLTATLEFTLAEKTLRLAPNFSFGAMACFALYLDQAHTDGSGPGTAGLLGDITISGVGLLCEIGGVEFTGISFWGEGTKPGLLEGTPYWEVYQIVTTDDGCCGPLGFDVAVYFLSGGLQLFDVEEIVANLSIQIATRFEFSTGISIDLTAVPSAFTEWTVGLLVEW
jgi:hypothetical protein